MTPRPMAMDTIVQVVAQHVPDLLLGGQPAQQVLHARCVRLRSVAVAVSRLRCGRTSITTDSPLSPIAIPCAQHSGVRRDDRAALADSHQPQAAAVVEAASVHAQP